MELETRMRMGPFVPEKISLWVGTVGRYKGIAVLVDGFPFCQATACVWVRSSPRGGLVR